MALTIPSIGGQPFVTLKGMPDPATGETLEDITRPNVDGVSFRKKGKRSKVFTVNTTADVDVLVLQDTMYDYKDLQGTIVTVVDENDLDWENVLVLEVRLSRSKAIKTVVGGLIGLGTLVSLLTATWTLQLTETVEPTP